MYIVSGLFNDAATCAEHVAWNGITTINNEFEMVQQNLIYHLSIYLGGLSKTGLQALSQSDLPDTQAGRRSLVETQLNNERLRNQAIQETKATNM
jgi:hypothetical protein